MQMTNDKGVARQFDEWEKLVTGQWKGKRWSDGVEEMEALLTKDDIHAHVSEVYSPPRVTGLCERLGLIKGCALDLTVDDPDDGKPWDFNDPAKRSKCLKMVLCALPLVGCRI